MPMGGNLHKHKHKRNDSLDADEAIERNIYFIEMLHIFRHFSSFV